MDPQLIARNKGALFLTNWRLHMVLPSVVAADEPFSLTMTLFGPDSMPAAAPDVEFAVAETRGIEGMPKTVRFTKETGGRIVIADLRAKPVDYAYVSVTLEVDSKKFEVKSNPAWVFENPPFRLYWGDIHVHTTYSNCSAWACKDPEFAYAFARDCSTLDFAAAADHLRGIASDKTRWPHLQDVVQHYDEPGRFVPILGFESSHKTGFGGDNNAYYLETEAPYFWLDREDMKGTGPAVSLQTLWDFLDATGKTAITIPHHTGRAGKYRDFTSPEYSPEREPLFEIYSGWGSSEKRDSRFPLRAGNSDKPCYFQDALLQGCRYVVIASSDMHTSMTGAEMPWRFPLGHQQLGWHPHHGLAAVKATGLNRDALWEGLVNRRTFATTFARSLLDISLGDAEMGEEIALPKHDPLRRKRTVHVKFASTDSGGATLTLVRNGQDVDTATWDGSTTQFALQDETAWDEACVRNAQFHPAPFAVYYVRAECTHGQTQWSSPIWVDEE